MKTCIIVPSHINHFSRSKLLIKCLESLINQTEKIPIYLSISFESSLDSTLCKALLERNKLLENNLLFIEYRNEKNSQFRHIEKTLNKIHKEYDFVMFCDDDDTYDTERVMSLIWCNNTGINECPENKIFVGSYESNINILNHLKETHEYWSYCVKTEFVMKFINLLKQKDDSLLDHIFCDMIFSTYLRRLNNNHVFSYFHKKLYNYTTSNPYSIIRQINAKNAEFKNKEVNVVKNFNQLVNSLNNHVQENYNLIKNSIIVKSLNTSFTFSDIIKDGLFRNGNDYKYIKHIRKDLITNLKKDYDTIKELCYMFSKI